MANIHLNQGSQTRGRGPQRYFLAPCLKSKLGVSAAHVFFLTCIWAFYIFKHLWATIAQARDNNAN